MSSSYELYLTDDAGHRIMPLQNYSFFSYSRSAIGFGTFEIGIPFEPFAASIYPFFAPDRRIEVWRSPELGYPMRCENVYFLRMYRLYTREDGVQIIVFYARDAKDLLKRRFVIQASGTQWTRKTDYIDDMMKDIVREQMLFGSALDANGTLDPTRYYPQDEFLVQENQSLGPIAIANFGDRNVLETLKALRDMSAQFALENIGDRKIYFDVVPYNVKSRIIEILDENGDPILDENGLPILDERSADTTAETGFVFQTFPVLRGTDRSNGVIFSLQNNNLKTPAYSRSHLDEINTAIVKGFGRGDSREFDVVQFTDNVNLSRWNRVEGYVDASNEPDQNNLSDNGEAFIYKNRPAETLNAVFLNIPGGPDSPRSLYGVDWDLGDLLPVEFGMQRFLVEVTIVYVSMNDLGEENISGMNEVDNAGN